MNFSIIIRSPLHPDERRCSMRRPSRLELKQFPATDHWLHLRHLMQGRRKKTNNRPVHYLNVNLSRKTEHCEVRVMCTNDLAASISDSAGSLTEHLRHLPACAEETSTRRYKCTTHADRLIHNIPVSDESRAGSSYTATGTGEALGSRLHISHVLSKATSHLKWRVFITCPHGYSRSGAVVVQRS